MKREMTKKQEQIYRLRHHDFEGLSTKETAKRLGISESSVQRTLRVLKKKSPQLFPILNKRQHFIHMQIADYGCTHKLVAEMLDVPIKTIDRIVEQMRAKGVSFAKPAKTVSYEPYLDDKVKQKY